jgi:hypothetical protein
MAGSSSFSSSVSALFLFELPPFFGIERFHKKNIRKTQTEPRYIVSKFKTNPLIPRKETSIDTMEADLDALLDSALEDFQEETQV